MLADGPIRTVLLDRDRHVSVDSRKTVVEFRELELNEEEKSVQ